MNKKVKLVFEFDRKDYENALFMLNVSYKDNEEVEKTWNKLKGEEIALTADEIAKQFAHPQSHIIAMFVSFAVNSVKD